MSIGSGGQLHNSIYDKRDDFNFHITNFFIIGEFYFQELQFFAPTESHTMTGLNGSFYEMSKYTCSRCSVDPT